MAANGAHALDREQLRRDGSAVYTKEKYLKTYTMSVENNFEGERTGFKNLVWT